MTDERLLDLTMDEIRRSLPLRIALWTAAAMVVLSVMAQVPLIVQRFIPPYTISEATPVSLDEIRAGDSLMIRYKVVRWRVCRIDLDRLIMGDDGSLLYRDRTPGGGHDLGSERTLVNSLHIPKDAKPGKYTLYTTASNECSDGLHTTDAPPVKFEVVE